MDVYKSSSSPIRHGDVRYVGTIITKNETTHQKSESRIKRSHRRFKVYRNRNFPENKNLYISILTANKPGENVKFLTQ